jgi:hypothetical protein
MSKSSELSEVPLQGVELGEMQGEKMHFVIILECAQLGARNYADAKAVASFSRAGNAVDRVMICECEGSEPARRRCFDNLLWRERAVRGGRMSVQVDERRPARRGSFAGHRS